MNQSLLIALLFFDVFLVVLFLIHIRRKPQNLGLDILKDIDHERRLVKELRDSVIEELERKHREMKGLYDKVSAIATEADVELKSGSQIVGHEVAQVIELAKRELDEPLKALENRRVKLTALIHKSQQERAILQKAVARAEKLAKFFDQKIPYEELIEEITDKKYSDARFLLAKGMRPDQVARELGLPESEVSIIASMKV